MRVKRVKPHEIPLRLLEQKKMWDLRVFYEYAANAGDSWLAFVMDEGDEDDPYAAVILADCPMSMAVDWQTLIIDKPRRTPERFRDVMTFGYAALRAFANRLGRRYICTSINDPDKYLGAIGHPPAIEIAEYVLREEI